MAKPDFPRGKGLDGVKFRRQQPIGPFVVDFYNSDHRLAIEVDGPVRELQQEPDRARQEILELLGLKVLRLNADMAEKNLPSALDLIRGRFARFENQRPRMSPLPLRERGRGEGE